MYLSADDVADAFWCRLHADVSDQLVGQWGGVHRKSFYKPAETKRQRNKTSKRSNLHKWRRNVMLLLKIKHWLSTVGFRREEMPHSLDKFRHVVSQEVDHCIRACIEGIRHLKDLREIRKEHLSGAWNNTDFFTKSSFLKFFTRTYSHCTCHEGGVGV